MAYIRRIAAVLATIGVLLHAGVIVRHNSMMVAADYERAAAVLGVICHDGRDGDDVSGAPSSPQDPSGKPLRCPICLGFTAAAILPDQPAQPPGHAADVSALPLASQHQASSHDSLWPPGRGPPAAAA